MWPAKSGPQDVASSRTWLQTILQSEGMGRSGPRLAVSKGTPILAAADGWTQAMEFPGIACQVRSCLSPPTVTVSRTCAGAGPLPASLPAFPQGHGAAGTANTYTLSPSQSSFNKINLSPLLLLICFKIHLRSIKILCCVLLSCCDEGEGGQEWKNGGDRNELQSSFSLSEEGQ